MAKVLTRNVNLVLLLTAILLLTGCTLDLALTSSKVENDSTPSPPSTSDPLCPANYSFVPSSTFYDTSDFCVAKYEMKITGDDNGDQPYNAAFVAESRASGTPWVRLTRDQAITECQALGPEYDLIRNEEWQTIARNLELVAWNWGSNTIGSALGISRSFGMSAGVAASTDDDACAGTGASCDLSTWEEHRRLHKLSGGDYIWDVGGNVAEWVKDDFPITYTFATVSAFTVPLAINLFGTLGDYTALSTTPFGGLGEFRGNTSGGTLTRGGFWDVGGFGLTSEAGIFTADPRLSVSDAVDYVGFRCVIRDPIKTQTIFPSHYEPILPYLADPTPIEVGQQFVADVNGSITGIRFYRSIANPSGYTATLWTDMGTPLATATTTDGTIPGWQTAMLATPVPITANTTYLVSYYSSNGQIHEDTSKLITDLSHGLNIRAIGGSGVSNYGSGSSGFPTLPWSDSNYFVDVIFEAD